MSKKKNPKHLATHTQPQSQITAVHQSFSGTLPHPELLNHYNKIIPGAAERILSMAEQDAAHQHNIEKMAIQYASDEAKRGQWFGLIIGVCVFVTAIISVTLGSEKTAMIVGGATVVGLVTVFITGRKYQTRNNNNTK